MRKIKSVIALILCISALSACTAQAPSVLPEEDTNMTTEQPVAPLPPVDTEPAPTEPVQTEPDVTEPVVTEPSVKPISSTEQNTDYSDYSDTCFNKRRIALNRQKSLAYRRADYRNYGIYR